MMGDNVTFNDTLAAALGVMRGKCLPHAEHRVVEDALLPLYNVGPTSFEHLVVRAGGVITAGGSNKRAAELAGPKYGLAPSKMSVYSNRFGSSLLVNKYRLANFEKVMQWHTTGAMLNLEPPDEDAAAGYKALKDRVAAAYKDGHAMLVMQIVDDMFGELSSTIAGLSAHGDNVDPRIIDDLIRQRKTYDARGADAAKTIEAACAKVNIVLPTAVKAAVTKFTPPVVQSSLAAAQKVSVWVALFVRGSE